MSRIQSAINHGAGVSAAFLSFAIQGAVKFADVSPPLQMGKAKKTHYAVVKGRMPGIYHTWDDCQKQTKGWPGAVFKGFKCHEDAQQYFSSVAMSITPSDAKVTLLEIPDSHDFDDEFGSLDVAALDEIENQVALLQSQTTQLPRNPQPDERANKGAKCPFKTGTDTSPKPQMPKVVEAPKTTPFTFCVRKKDDPARTASFPASCSNALARKQNVSLTIKQGEVWWQFNYNKVVIDAVKECIKGRRYDGATKQWVCPIETLPECVALFEFCGRKVDKEVKQRAEQIKATATRPDDITAVLDFSPGPLQSGLSHEVLGRVKLSFHFDKDIIAKIKQLHPMQRAWHAEKKVWSVDLLSLGELLEIFSSELGYESPAEVGPILSAIETLAAQMEESEGEAAKAACGVAEAINASQSCVKRVKLDRTDAGQEAKRRSLTAQQQAWGIGGIHAVAAMRDGDLGWDSCLNALCDFSYVDSFVSRCRMKRETPTDCDCGHPQKLQGGRHICRYYGSFECPGCRNRWTSAYTWKGEKQACRGCEMESLPVKTEPLQGSKGTNISGAHDCARCSRCRKLGEDCTGGRGTWS